MTDKPMCCEACGMINADNVKMRKAGTALAEAALFSVREFDGLHRLSLAVSDWSRTIALEGPRADLYGTERDSPLRALQLIADEAGRSGLNARDKVRQMERLAINAIEAITGSPRP